MSIQYLHTKLRVGDLDAGIRFYETVFGVRMIRAEERLRAVAADSVAAAHLQVPAGTPLLCVDRIAFTYGDKPVEWRRGRCVTDGFSYFNELN